MVEYQAISTNMLGEGHTCKIAIYYQWHVNVYVAISKLHKLGIDLETVNFISNGLIKIPSNLAVRQEYFSTRT